MTTTLEQLIPLVAERYNVPAIDISGTTTMEALGIDSLAQIELMFDLEDHFDVRFGNHQDPLKSIQEVADLIDQCRAQNAH